MATHHPRHAGKFGKLAPRFPAAVKEFKSYLLPTLPAPPASVNNYAGISFPMDGNDQYGDCTMAAAAHAIQCWNQISQETDAVPDTQAIVAEYFKLTGGPDAGLVVTDVLKTWQQTGLWKNSLVGYAPVNVHDETSIQQAINLYGLAYAGLQVPANAETQFNDQQPWTLAPGWRKQKIVGGHAIPLVGYDATYLYAVTWGAVQQVAWDWFQTYGDEVWALLPDQYQRAGKVDGIDFATLQADLADV